MTDHWDRDIYGDPDVVYRRVAASLREATDIYLSEQVPEMYGNALYYRALDDGRCIVVYLLIAGTVRIAIGPKGDQMFDDAWCYSTQSAGLLAAAIWDGNGDPPEGWFRNLSTARRRPEGNPEWEYIAE